MDQIAKASSWNATANRRTAGSSTPARIVRAARSAPTQAVLHLVDSRHGDVAIGSGLRW
jgi:hypothetical protein